MNAVTANIWLETCLAPIAEHLGKEDVTDIWINRPGEVWLESLGGRIERHATPTLTAPLLLRMATQIAALTAQGINRENPILSGSLPGGERVQVIIPPATRGDVAIAIRKHVSSGMTLDAYRESGAFSRVKSEDIHDREPTLVSNGLLTDPMTFLRAAVKERRNILISGGTSTGKTTFLNALLQEVPEHERLILIEDVPEIRLTHPNAVGLLASRSVLGEASISAEDLLVASLRMRPDRIILGEIRGSEAGTFLRAINTGHPGSITTIHANSPMRAIDQLALLVLQTGIRMAWDDVVMYVRRSLDVIMQLTHDTSGRYVTSIALLK